MTGDSEVCSNAGHNGPPVLSDIWYRIVSEYSNRELTVPEDKLPAISGVAIEMARISLDEYCAGLWRRQLRRELLWSTYPLIKVLKPAVWRAPSWSWASVNNRITFERMPPTNAQPLGEIIECSVTPKAAKAPFGEVREGSLRIKAPLMEIQDEQIDGLESLLYLEYTLPKLKDEDKGLEFRRFIMNVMLERSQGERERMDVWNRPENVVLLALWRHNENMNNIEKLKNLEPGDHGFVSCLVLTKREDGKYERVCCLPALFLQGLSKLKADQIIEIV